jgi:ribosomal protein S18 acetylase RimI-like enzyme
MLRIGSIKNYSKENNKNTRMNTQLLIRPATATDIPAIRHIAHHTWPVAYGQLLSKEQLGYMLALMYSVESLEEQMNKGHQFYIAELDGKPHGFASVSQEDENRYKLNKLYVLPGTQKTGAGKALLQQAINFAKENKGRQLFLQVKKDNPSKTFYDKQGFTVIGEVVLDIGNGYVMDDYYMAIDIHTS